MFFLDDDGWEVVQTSSRGRGIATLKPITKGTVIGDYLGTVIDFAEFDLQEDAKGLYAMYYTDRVGIYPDVQSDDIHLINHSCDPNCWMYIYHGHTLFFAIRDITLGEELTISYLLSPRDELCAVCIHDCHCRRPHCSGTMHLTETQFIDWQIFQEKERKKTSTAPFVIGEPLAPLPLYPTTLPVDPIYQTLIGSMN